MSRTFFRGAQRRIRPTNRLTEAAMTTFRRPIPTAPARPAERAGAVLAALLALVVAAVPRAAWAQVDCVPALESPVALTPGTPAYRPPGLSTPAGFVEEEYVLSCTALGSRYRTVVNVLRPADPGSLRRVVVVEPTHPGNIWPVRGTSHAYLAREGVVSIAVSSSRAVVEQLVRPAADRYAELDIPGVDEIESEILAQLGTSLKTGGLPGVQVGPVILAGYSNTGARVRQYIVDRHIRARLPDGGPIYDGFFPAQTAVGTLPGPIPDLDVPVIELQGEREIIATLIRNPGGLTYRRPDGPNYRLYEVPGMAHLDTREGNRAFPRESCMIETPSSFPLRHLWDASLRNLVQWVAAGTLAPAAEWIRMEADARTIARDPHGNALGGVRTALLDVPVATYLTVSDPRPGASGGRCDMVGPQHDFSTEQLRSLYGSHAEYQRRFQQRLDQLVREGWYLDFHADDLRREAAARPHF